MDLFTGAVGTGQVHDFNPGTDNGLFWTVPVPGDKVSADIQNGSASLGLTNFDVEDYHNLHNALVDGPSDPATVSFEMSWTAIGDPMNVTDPVHHFDGRFSLAEVQIAWSATTANFTFVSDPASTTHNVRSVIGHERNGIFFTE